jgi:hypothetical protein
VSKVDDQSWSAADGSSDQQQVVIPIGALGGLKTAELNGIHCCVSNSIAVGPPAAAAAAARVLPAALEPAAAAGNSWCPTADGFHSSISNAGSSLIQPESDTTLVAAAAAPAVVSATDSQAVQLWPAGPASKQRQFVLLTPLQLEVNPNRHTLQQQQQQQQQLSPLPSQTDDNNSATRSNALKRPPPCEAQTWLVMEYCNGG